MDETKKERGTIEELMLNRIKSNVRTLDALAACRDIVQANTPVSHCEFCRKQAVLIQERDMLYVECLWCHARGPRYRGIAAPARALRAWETKRYT